MCKASRLFYEKKIRQQLVIDDVNINIRKDSNFAMTIEINIGCIKVSALLSDIMSE